MKDNDKTSEIDMLTKQKELLQSKCREAGVYIAELRRDNQLLSQDNVALTDRLRKLGL